MPFVWLCVRFWLFIFFVRASCVCWLAPTLLGTGGLEVRGHGARPPLLVDLHVGGLRRPGRNHLASAEPLRRPDSDRPRNLGHRHRNAPQSSEERVQDSKYEHLLALRRCSSAEKDVCFLWIFPQRTMQSEPDCFCNRNILRKVKKEETMSKEKSSRILKATGNKFWRLCLVLIFAWYEKVFYKRVLNIICRAMCIHSYCMKTKWNFLWRWTKFIRSIPKIRKLFPKFCILCHCQKIWTVFQHTLLQWFLFVA